MIMTYHVMHAIDQTNTLWISCVLHYYIIILLYYYIIIILPSFCAKELID